jgi:hypothetical protein
LNPSTAGFYVNPVRSVANPSSTNVLVYDTSTKEITNSGKTFVINHPIDNSKYLVHACLEGPESGVYYRGKSEIKINEDYTEIELPEYVEFICKELTAYVTPIYNGYERFLSVSEVESGVFRVYGKPGKFNWYVMGTRETIEVEPEKHLCQIKGVGPYTWI